MAMLTVLGKRTTQKVSESVGNTLEAKFLDRLAQMSISESYSTDVSWHSHETFLWVNNIWGKKMAHFVWGSRYNKRWITLVGTKRHNSCTFQQWQHHLLRSSLARYEPWLSYRRVRLHYNQIRFGLFERSCSAENGQLPLLPAHSWIEHHFWCVFERKTPSLRCFYQKFSTMTRRTCRLLVCITWNRMWDRVGGKLSTTAFGHWCFSSLRSRSSRADMWKPSGWVVYFEVESPFYITIYRAKHATEEYEERHRQRQELQKKQQRMKMFGFFSLE